MTFFDLLQESRPVLLASSAALGLIIGSFLNVVILRLPVMLEHGWRRDCQEYLGIEGEEDASPPISLVSPRSSCSSCGHPIGALENIPVLSYLLLGGRCSGCGARISLRYPLIEAATAAITFIIAYRFGPSVQTVAAMFFGWTLLCLAVIDAERQILPDSITLPLLWLGLVVNSQGLLVSADTAILGAAFGYGLLWLVYQLFRLATGKEGMGYGDFKLLSAIGAWLGWQALPVVIVLSSAVGASLGILMIALARLDRSKPIPFGPFLALAGFISLIAGDRILTFYLDFAGLSR